MHRVIKAFDLEETFDFIATRDDVEHGKPDPEIYRLVSSQLKVPPEDCLVVEDSPTGVRAALGARIWSIAVTTPFTQESLHKSHLLDEHWIVDDPDNLPHVVRSLFHKRAAEEGSDL